MNSVILMMGILYLLLPFTFISLLWFKRFRSRADWLAHLFLIAIYFTYILIVGRWDFFSFYLRGILLVFLLLASLRSLFRAKEYTWLATEKKWRYRISITFTVLLGLFFFILTASAVLGYFYNKEAIALEFPLQDGTYYTAHGGNSESINYHNSSPTQQFALDIVALNGFGTRANGLMPAKLKDYKIYGKNVYSPCTGKVKTAVNDIQEIPAQAMTQETKNYRRNHPAGNHVILACKDAEVLIAHMIQGSVGVKEGQQVHTGQQIGKVGNSGNTSEPHLHIQAQKDGQSTPITFNTRFLKRNSLIYR
ncbi:M23 family metallopeptidase [Bacillus tianshenii]|nr:M23 family metallopeptidase [Bacillus tianshenii]